MAVEYEARVARIVEHAPDTRSLFLRGPRIAFRPGQFISCLLPVGGETLIRPYSLASSPEEGDLEICLNLVPGGRASPYLLTLPVGAQVRFTGPWGTFVLDRAPEAEAVFIADGTGIAPIRPMLRRALATATRHPLRLLYGAESREPLLYRTELEAMAREHRDFDCEHVPSARLDRAGAPRPPARRRLRAARGAVREVVASGKRSSTGIDQPGTAGSASATSPRR